MSLLLLSLSGCREPDPSSASPAPQEVSAPAETSPPEAAPPAGVLSNDGAYYVTYRSDPDPIPLNEPFRLTVRVQRGADRSTPVRDIQLEVDGRMPHHKHGMNQVPLVSESDDGSFDVQGMLFHMAGYWEIYFDVRAGGVTERAQTAVVLE